MSKVVKTINECFCCGSKMSKYNTNKIYSKYKLNNSITITTTNAKKTYNLTDDDFYNNDFSFVKAGYMVLLVKSAI